MTSFDKAREAYAKFGVDVDAALKALSHVSVSLPCWQADDVAGFEKIQSSSSGGVAAIGGHPGRARNGAEIRADAEKAFSLIPGPHRFNIHAFYGEFGGASVDRDQIETQHFQGWIDWAKRLNIALDFNPTLFAHPKADDGFTLTNKDPTIRAFWIEHVRRCRVIAQDIARALQQPVTNNIWIPDGFKDICIDRVGHRQLLKDSLDRIFSDERIDKSLVFDAVEGKLFGIGIESCTFGSHDFYLGYAVQRSVGLCMDMGHFHPTESVGDKVSAVLAFLPRVLIHVSRAVRWDSDHVCIVNDDLNTLAEEVVRSNGLDIVGGLPRVVLAVDSFDASINRVGAWIIGARAVLRALLAALLQPLRHLKALEEGKKYFERLALLEECKAMPFSAIWDEFCRRQNVPVGRDWIASVAQYESKVLLKRSKL